MQYKYWEQKSIVGHMKYSSIKPRNQHCLIIVGAPWCSALNHGHSLKNRVQICTAQKTPPLFMPFWPLAVTPIQHFSVRKSLSLLLPNYKFIEILSSKASKLASNWVKIQFTWLHVVKRFSSLGSQIWQWSIYKPLCSALWVKYLYQNES